MINDTEGSGMSARTRWIVIASFSAAMAWMESATVAYLRTLLDRVEPYQSTPLPSGNPFGGTELIREGATLAMLLTVAWLCGKSWKSRAGYFMTAFGMWDIFYYLFLKLIVGWPHSLFDWDVLFLMPLPWWGPVLSPILVSVLLVAGGVLMVSNEETGMKLSLVVWLMWTAGVAVILYTFMATAIQGIHNGLGPNLHRLPVDFSWPLFVIALVLMSAPIVEAAAKRWRTTKIDSEAMDAMQ